MSSDDVREYPPGVSGQVWDLARDAPVHVGRVELRSQGRAVAAGLIDADGGFGIETTPGGPLLSDVYELIVEAPGYLSAQRRIEVRADVPACRVGRIDLEPARGRLT